MGRLPLEHRDGLVIGGGNIIHALPSDLPAYNEDREFAYANLWLAATCAPPVVL